VLILEDDIEPTADFSERIGPTLAAVPDDWGQIFLGAAVLQDARFRAVNPFVRRIVGVNRTHGYITRLEMIEELYPFVFSLWSLADKESPRAYLQHIDHQMHHFHRQTSRRVYLAHPQLLGQCESYSDVLGMKVHYGQTG
jgi:GR25 family glycosyltransferase involved in LPS biosynthesis